MIHLCGFPSKDDLPPFERVQAVGIVVDVLAIGFGQEYGPSGLRDGVYALTNDGDNGRRKPFKRFIKEQALWIQSESTGNGQHFALAAAQLCAFTAFVLPEVRKDGIGKGNAL